jgi:ketopantoate reductase
MPTENSRILVIGAGVNGSICAVGLHRAGFNVTMLARGKRYEELQAQGIVIKDALKQTQAPDEMNQLAAELEVLVKRSGLPVPALRELLDMKRPATLNKMKHGA